MRHCKCLIILFIAFFPVKIFSQPDIDITGLWKGTLYNDTTKQYHGYEIGISEEKGKLSGFSHTWFFVNDKKYYGVKKLKVRKANDGKIIIEDAGVIAYNYPEEPPKGVRQLNVLTLEVKDSILKLTGPFTTNRTKVYSSVTGTIELQRRNDYWQSALVPHLQELGMETKLSFVAKDYELEKIEAEKKLTKAEIIIKRKSDENIANNKAIAIKERSASESPLKIDLPERTAKKSLPSTDSNAIAKTEVLQKDHSEKTITGTDKKLNEFNNNEKNNNGKPSAQKIAVNEAKASAAKINLPAAEIETRKTIIQQTVFFKSDSLQISLYDNGEVDGDTVSVLMNGSLLMANQRLSTNAIRKTIYTDQTVDSIQLVMYAENLGSIAPNTGLLVVRDGKDIYEIRFSGDLQKSAAIILRRKK
jgi:hypothetical protein